MNRSYIAALCLLFSFVTLSQAALVWRPGEGWVTEGSGESLAASDAKAALQLARNQEAKEDYKAALDTYRDIVRRWPLSTSAGEAQFKVGLMLEKRTDYWDAYLAYQKGIEKYPASQFFDLSIEREFAVGNLFLNGEPQKLFGIPTFPSMDKTVEIYNTVIKNAPFGTYAPQAYFKIGLAREKQKDWSEAIAAYNKLLEKYPGSDLAQAAQYQIGYAWYQASSQPDYDQSAAEKSIDAFQDYLVKYPDSEKSRQAHKYMDELSGRRTQGSYNIALFYLKQKQYSAAVIYFNDVIQQSPNSPIATQAKQQLEKIKSISGGKLPGPAVRAAAAPKKYPSSGSKAESGNTEPIPDNEPLPAPAPENNSSDAKPMPQPTESGTASEPAPAPKPANDAKPQTDNPPSL